MSEPIDIPELMMTDLTALLTAAGALPSGGVKVGPLTDTEQQAGAVSVVEAGASTPEIYAPIIHSRIQVRCVHPRLVTAQSIGRSVYNAWHKAGRRTATITANGNTYLVHGTVCVAGPSQHYDTQETWEYLLFFSAMVGDTAL